MAARTGFQAEARVPFLGFGRLTKSPPRGRGGAQAMMAQGLMPFHENSEIKRVPPPLR